MKAYAKQFLACGAPFETFHSAAVAVLPVPYEGGGSYGKGAARGPDAVLEASQYLELYDEALKAEPHRMGVVTVAPPDVAQDPELLEQAVFLTTRELISAHKFTVMLGGDHSITYGYAKALAEACGGLSVIQLDAHADLRESYDGTSFSHACIMSRIRGLTANTLQIGVRSMSLQEAQRIGSENLALCTMEEFRARTFDLDGEIERLPDPVFLTIDVDAFDWSVVRSTGTPEPGGFLWDEAICLLRKIFYRKRVVGFDVVELSSDEADRNSPFAVAKLIYKMLGFKLASCVAQDSIPWPEGPSGSLFPFPSAP